MLIKAEGLCKDYGKKSVLHDVDFTINKGDIYGLVGKNGAGKTTIMRIMTGLQVPTKGTISYGFDRTRLGSVGALVELPSIYANKSAYENIKFQYLNLGLKVDDSINEILRLVGLDNTGNKPAGKFSLGMRQRLGIAMAMVGDPEVLVLDEPINGLDPQGIIGVRDLLIRLNREKGITVIISSHILSELSKLATRYAFRVLHTAYGQGLQGRDCYQSGQGYHPRRGRYHGYRPACQGRRHQDHRLQNSGDGS